MLSCRAIGGIPTPTLVWQRRDRAPLSRRVEEKYSGTILISNITFEDAGEYECHASNIAGEVSQSASVVVQQSPQIRIIPDTIELTVTESDELKLECTAEGNPRPSVYWKSPSSYQRGESVSNVYGAPAALPQGIIHKYNIGREDEGTYICHASNAAGEDEKYITVIVQPKRGDVGTLKSILILKL